MIGRALSLFFYPSAHSEWLILPRSWHTEHARRGQCTCVPMACERQNMVCCWVRVMWMRQPRGLQSWSFLLIDSSLLFTISKLAPMGISLSQRFHCSRVSFAHVKSRKTKPYTSCVETTTSNAVSQPRSRTLKQSGRACTTAVTRGAIRWTRH